MLIHKTHNSSYKIAIRAIQIHLWLLLADVYADQLLKMAPGVPNVTYSLISNTADVYAYKVNYNIWETVIDVQTPFGMVKIITTLIGRNNVYNVLAAIAAGLSMSIPLKVQTQIICALSMRSWICLCSKCNLDRNRCPLHITVA